MDKITNIKVLIERQENADFFNVPINTVKEIAIEHYIAGVVASEIGNSPLEACKAQAVAARSYALNYKQPISDLSTKAQAYRAARVSVSKYPNAIKAAFLTAGEILTYNNKVINAVYSSSNGGFTVSCQQRWGNVVPYLIAQEDPWDKAAGSSRNGHGVGMSQKGAIYAAKQNVSYKDILAFYYPHTTLKSNYGEIKHNLRISKDIAEYFYDALRKEIK